MLTERIIRDTNPGPKPVILWDSQVAGLGCKVFPSGRKAFVLSYRIGLTPVSWRVKHLGFQGVRCCLLS